MEPAYKRSLLEPIFDREGKRSRVVAFICSTDDYPEELKVFMEEQDIREECNLLYRDICLLRTKVLFGDEEEKRELQSKLEEYMTKTAEYEKKKERLEDMFAKISALI